MRATSFLSVLPVLLITATILAGVAGCQLTPHPTEPAALGQARPSSEFEALIHQPGPVVVETVVGADL